MLRHIRHKIESNIRHTVLYRPLRVTNLTHGSRFASNSVDLHQDDAILEQCGCWDTMKRIVDNAPNLRMYYNQLSDMYRIDFTDEKSESNIMMQYFVNSKVEDNMKFVLEEKAKAWNHAKNKVQDIMGKEETTHWVEIVNDIKKCSIAEQAQEVFLGHVYKRRLFNANVLFGCLVGIIIASFGAKIAVDVSNVESKKKLIATDAKYDIGNDIASNNECNILSGNTVNIAPKSTIIYTQKVIVVNNDDNCKVCRSE